MDDLEIGRADRNGLDAGQYLGACRNGHRLFVQHELLGITQHPGFHRSGTGNPGDVLTPAGWYMVRILRHEV